MPLARSGKTGYSDLMPPSPEMQIVQHIDLSTEQARALTDKIKSTVGDLMILVAKAWQGRVWIALDYGSWADYIKGEFNYAPLALPREERQAVVKLLRGQGMSTRAIGAATGVHHDTVASDLSTVGNPTEIVSVTGLDGRIRNFQVTCAKPPEAVQPAPSQITAKCPTCGGTGRIAQ